MGWQARCYVAHHMQLWGLEEHKVVYSSYFWYSISCKVVSVLQMCPFPVSQLKSKGSDRADIWKEISSHFLPEINQHFLEGFLGGIRGFCLVLFSIQNIALSLTEKWGTSFTQLLEEQKCRQQYAPLLFSLVVRAFVHRREDLVFVLGSGCMRVKLHFLPP